MEKRWICLLLVALLILSGCKHTPLQAETQQTANGADEPTAVETAAGTTDAETEATQNTTVPETSESVSVSVPETSPPTAPATQPPTVPTTQPPAESQEATIPETTACLHTNTVTVNEKTATTEEEGYTGDNYCTNCGILLAAGQSIPKKIKMLTYTSPNGLSYTVEEGTNISDYTMKLNTWTESHPYSAIEQEVFYLCNLAREKYGLAPLTWNEDAYCFTKIRAQDCFTLYDHVRPNGGKWNSVYEDHGVFLYCISGENLNQASGCTAEHITNTQLMADMIFSSWLDSDGHRENMLRSTYTSVSIAVLWSETESVCYVAQNFFGY